jgi:hypothetical protein
MEKIGSRGLLFTAGAFMVGFVLIYAAAGRSLKRADDCGFNTHMEFARAKAKSQNAAWHIGCAFKKHSGITIGQEDTTIDVNGRLPHEFEAYLGQIRILKIAHETLDNETTIHPGIAKAYLENSINATFEDEVVFLELSENAQTVLISTYTGANITYCNTTEYSPGNIRITFESDGVDGICRLSKEVNMSGHPIFKTDGITVLAQENSLTLKSNIKTEYEIRIRLNETKKTTKTMLSGYAKTQIGKTTAKTHATI